jgi:hypothetical protein
MEFSFLVPYSCCCFIVSSRTLKVGAHLPSSDGRHGSEFIITYIVSNAPALTCPHRTAMPTGIPEIDRLS